jgi:steroid delta-isomerase
MTESLATGTVSWEAPDADHPARRAAQRSMAAVAAGRKGDWLGLFTADAVVEDPVGPSALDPEGKGHRGHDGIERFWDEHVSAVSRFDFQVKDSFVSITMTIGAAATMTVDCVVVYTVNDTGQITSLRGYWEPDRATATLAAL